MPSTKERQKLQFYLSLLSRFRAGSHNIKAKRVFLTTSALVKDSAKETLCTMHCGAAIFRMAMKSLNPSAKLMLFSHPLPYHADE